MLGTNCDLLALLAVFQENILEGIKSSHHYGRFLLYYICIKVFYRLSLFDFDIFTYVANKGDKWFLDILNPLTARWFDFDISAGQKMVRNKAHNASKL